MQNRGWICHAAMHPTIAVLFPQRYSYSNAPYSTIAFQCVTILFPQRHLCMLKFLGRYQLLFDHAGTSLANYFHIYQASTSKEMILARPVTTLVLWWVERQFGIPQLKAHMCWYASLGLLCTSTGLLPQIMHADLVTISKQ